MGHNRNKGFSQTSKRFDGDLKDQHRRSRNKQMDHLSPKREESEPEVDKTKSSEWRIGRR